MSDRDTGGTSIDNHHDVAGARALERYFPPLVTACVRHHVRAKPYLCATDSAYFGRLSSASVRTLALQGGPMDESEVAEFEALPYLADIVQVRRWDDAAKVAGSRAPPFEHYVPILQRVVVDSEADR